MVPKSRRMFRAAMALVLSGFFLACEAPEDPAPEGSFSISDGAPFVSGASVTLTMNMSDAVSMRFSDDAVAWTDWEPYAPEKAWVLPDKPGFNVVHAEFRNEAGAVTGKRDSIASFVGNMYAAPDGNAMDRFSGYNDVGLHSSSISIAQDGTLMNVGALSSRSMDGAAYMLGWNGTSWDATVQNVPDGLKAKYYGFSTSTSSDGSVVAVSGLLDVVFVYRKTAVGWDRAEIKATGPAVSQSFGVAVALSGDGNTLVVGAYLAKSSTGKARGCLYVYEWNGSTWNGTRVEPSGADVDMQLGFHVAVSTDGNTVAGGAVLDLAQKGSVFVYKRSPEGWKETKIAASAGDSLYFGRYVDLSADGTRLAVGAYKTRVLTNDQQGRAYVYSWNGSDWEEKAIDTPNAQYMACFGYCTILSDDGSYLLIGAPGETVDSKMFAGATYLFKLTSGSWESIRRFTATIANPQDYFGYHAAMSADKSTIVIGAPGTDIVKSGTTVLDQGAIYVY